MFNLVFKEVFRKLCKKNSEEYKHIIIIFNKFEIKYKAQYTVTPSQ